MRSSVKNSTTGECVFTAGAYCIIMSKGKE